MNICYTQMKLRMAPSRWTPVAVGACRGGRLSPRINVTEPRARRDAAIGPPRSKRGVADASISYLGPPKATTDVTSVKHLLHAKCRCEGPHHERTLGRTRTDVLAK
jgi:hypothetical protein